MTNRVRLTQAAATRFPDLAGRTGSLMPSDLAPDVRAWVRVVWETVEHEGQTTMAWLKAADVETMEDEA